MTIVNGARIYVPPMLILFGVGRWLVVETRL